MQNFFSVNSILDNLKEVEYYFIHRMADSILKMNNEILAWDEVVGSDLPVDKTTVFWSPNITLGVNYLLFAAKFLKKIAPWVDIEVNEEHFKMKQGTSGTAVKIAEALDVDKENINSVRAGGIVGKHEVIFGFPYQTVRLIHESISREAFGNGVVFVAENLEHKQKGLYNFEDILTPYFTV